MEYLPGDLTLELPDGVFPLSTDSMVLAHFIRLPKQARVLDLGSGCGTLGLLLCAGCTSCHVTGLEITEIAHAAALRNISRNSLEDRMESICGDLRTFPFIPGSFQCCVSNPPYFNGGPASRETPLARREDCCSPAELLSTASRALQYGGDLYMVHRPEKLGQLIAEGGRYGLEAKRLRLIHHRVGGPLSLVLLQMRKGGKPGLQIDEFCLYDSRMEHTDYYREVYHI